MRDAIAIFRISNHVFVRVLNNLKKIGMTNYSVNLPLFLESYVEFMQHIEGLYTKLSNPAKGAEFAKFSKDILSTQEKNLGLKPELNTKQTHDEGVDVFWFDPETNEQKIYCQCKLHIRGKDDLDNIIGKFSSYEKSHFPTNKDTKQLSIFDSSEVNQTGNSESKSSVSYCIATLSITKNILDLYKNSGRPSVNFYQNLADSNRIEIIDGQLLYKLFLEAYRKEYAIPQRVLFKVHEKFVNYHNVYMGIISAGDLIKIYSECGQGIFFENVRDFLGLDARNSALDINNEIFKTATNEPDKMLERNNGITFKASYLEYKDGNLILENAGIINGCQTTMCIVEAQPLGDCFVPVKIVIADLENSSKVAKTANTQNKIEKINLELSEYLRPQLVKMSLAEIGVKINEHETLTSVPSIASAICYNRIFYSDLRYLFIGLFSYIPRNIFISDYASIKFDDLGNAYPSLDDKKSLVSIIGNILTAANKVFDKLKEEYPSEANLQDSKGKIGQIFNRFYVDEKGYKPYLIVFAMCCLLNVHDEKQFKEQSVKPFVDQINNIIESRESDFEEALKKSFKAVAISVISRSTGKDRDVDQEIRQKLFTYLKTTEFSSFYLTYGAL